MQFYPVMEIMDKTLFKKPNLSMFYLPGIGIRIVGALFVGTIGYFVPFFGLISGLIGALGSSTLSFILPVILHEIVFKGKLHWAVMGKDLLILIFGVVALAVGTVFAIKDIVNALR